MLEQWQPLLDGLHSVFVGLLAWLASLGTVVAGILMLVILAMHLGIALGAAKQVLLETLLVCIKSILGCDDVEALAQQKMLV